MQIEIKTVKLKEIKLNPSNPRRISTIDMDRLVKSLKEFPEMLNIREIVVDETMMVLGGNARTMALRKIGAKECRAKIVTGLTDEQKREFIIKDNTGFGEFDFDILANSWSDLPLDSWGIDLPAAWLQKPEEKKLPQKEIFEVIVVCEDEATMSIAYEKLQSEGYQCRLSIF